MGTQLLPTTLAGSYPQPEWPVDREKVRRRPSACARSPDLWRLPDPFLAEAQDDATTVAIRAIEQAGIDIVLPVSGLIRRLKPVSTTDLSFPRANTDRKMKLQGPFTMTRQAETPLIRITCRLRRCLPKPSISKAKTRSWHGRMLSNSTCPIWILSRRGSQVCC